MAGRLVFSDAHAHSNPVKGIGAKRIAEKFRSIGGWFIALVALSPWHYGIDARLEFEAYRKMIEIHMRECKAAKEAGLRVACLAGFHPADVDKLLEKGLNHLKVLELGLKVVEYVARLCKEGLLDGIGEVGRQHYTTRPENVAISMEIARRALELSRDYDCIVHLHLENAGEITVKLTELDVERIGARKERLLLHHSKPGVASYAVQHGFYATLPGKEQLLSYYFGNYSQLVDRVLLESDYIDDPKRPCVSSCPWEVVERLKRLANQGVISEEVLYKINVDNVVKFYGVEPP
ncbi:TatD-related deoxyribonuclease [Pyrolobus fumarii 1A]|uniref:TatD-related deoxyribonuclease n=1 Tax=Pyrolobus fumarii (strain DSM 11204 / 1A) TaxID=694429 RepID=G0EHL2_PYRF1|nr:TatD family hydrolase [Pyrolobus fumarii]AEM39365.1 TatD-related deoxyribonuclease [Pyrolobus fumarii 1A]